MVALTTAAWAQNGAPPRAATGNGLKPGDVLDQSNWQKAEGLLPPEILRHYRDGEYVNPIVEWGPDTFKWPQDLREATDANQGKYSTSEQGGIIEVATGKQPTQIFGLPFPKIDPADPAAGVKVVWNYFYMFYYWGNTRAQVQVNWIAPGGLERRTDQENDFNFLDGQPPHLRVPNPQNFLYRNLILVTSPADLSGTAALTWRYRDPKKRDSQWTYVPALRRVRAVSPANRSDGFLGSDMSPDDGPFFDGKPEDFTFTLKEEIEQYRLVDPLSLQGKARHEWVPGGGWRSYWPDIPYLGYHDPKWKGVGWAPIAFGLAKRPLYVVSAVPKDRYYLYGHFDLYIDKETFQGAWDRKFSWAGELLNVYQVAEFAPYAKVRPDGIVDYLRAGNMNFQCAESVKYNRATVAGQRSSPNAALDLRCPFDDELFDMNTLSRLGK